MKNEHASNTSGDTSARAGEFFFSQPQTAAARTEESILRLFADDAPPSSSRPLPRTRHKLWELPINLHCPLIGTCLVDADLRKLSKRCGIAANGMSEYELHALFVNHCETRGTVSQQLQKTLDERYAASIQRFTKAKTGPAVLALWQQALAEGRIQGSLWAAWTHPEADESVQVAVYGDLHMLSHHLGAQDRSERKRLVDLDAENAALRRETNDLKNRLETAHREKRRLESTLAERDDRIAHYESLEKSLAEAKDVERRNLALRERNDTLSERAATLEKRNTELRNRVGELEKALAQASIPRLFAADCLPEAGSADDETSPEGLVADSPLTHECLAGLRILCIGGRPGLIDHYRRLVEESGGEFVHHDGGIEEHGGRIDDLMTGIDAVICQIRNVSHAAYYRVKAACKDRQLPCLFLESGGVTTFVRSLGKVARRDFSDSLLIRSLTAKDEDCRFAA